LQRFAIEVASEDSNRPYSTAWVFDRIVAHHMGPQSLEDPLSAVVSEFDASKAGRAVAVAYMQRWARLRFCMLELQILGHSPRMLCDATTYIVINCQDEPI
jgi:hypothetical protein|tara:strand:- start:195 stop:497 length:303 start_codon:yes stop_codon:yes gene_type:complete